MSPLRTRIPKDPIEAAGTSNKPSSDGAAVEADARSDASDARDVRAQREQVRGEGGHDVCVVGRLERQPRAEEVRVGDLRGDAAVGGWAAVVPNQLSNYLNA